jgi:hypothetical protein
MFDPERKERLEKILKIISILAIIFCCVLLFPHMRSFIVVIAEKAIGRDLRNPDKWMNLLLKYSLVSIFCFCITLMLLTRHVNKKFYIKVVNYRYFPWIILSMLPFIVSVLIFNRLYFNGAFVNPVPILKTMGTFFLFVISFSLTWVFVLQKMKDWRSSFVIAFLYFGLYVWILTEILSLFGILTPAAILCGWIVYVIIILTLIIKLYKTGKLELKMPQIFPFQWEYSILVVILSVTFFIAMTYPPNNYDSMSYHLPRIEHWLQNKSLNHYYTSITRQLFSAPFAEILILQGRALSGDDYLANLVQWFSLLGSIIGITKIVSHLGMDRKKQFAAAIFFATVPMAILQASSTQTDLVEAFCIICLAECLLAWRKSGTLHESLALGLALGLSILTKGTAYSIAFPFVLYVAIMCLKHFRKRFIGGCLAAILCLIINFPHYTRNFISFQNPLGAHGGTVSNFTIKSFVITLFSNVNSNLVFTPNVANGANKLLEKVFNYMGTDNVIFHSSLPSVHNIYALRYFNEDDVKNISHMIVIIITFFLFVFGKKRDIYILIVIGSWCMFAYCIPWQPWITRLQVPLFALSAPVFVFVFENRRKLGKIIILLLICYAILHLSLNISRPLLHINGINVDKTIWNTFRDDLIDQFGYSSYTDACATVVYAGIQNLGLIIGGNSWEYPLWRYVRNNSDKKIRITHVIESNIDKNIDALFLVNARTTDIMPNRDIRIPLVLIRDVLNKTEWENITQYYELTKNVDLSKKKSKYQYIGWSFAESWGTWTDGSEAVLDMYINSVNDLYLHLNVQHISNKNPVAVYINDVLLGNYEFYVGENVIRIPNDLYPDKTLVIRFVFKNAMSPMELGLSEERRKLGIGISSYYITDRVHS